MNLEQRLQRLEDQSALKHLVDSFSNLADEKNVAAQMQLFTEDATVTTYFGDTLFAQMTGREEIAQVFSGFLANFETVYHLNGQMTVDIDGDQATADHYCLVVLTAGQAQGQPVKTINGVIYKDQYMRRNGQWLIAQRLARFSWRDQSAFIAPQ